MTHFIPYSRQYIEEDDIAAVVKVLRSDWLTQGPHIEQFENAVASYCTAPHAVAINSATAGLHLTCMALGVTSGDVVWTSPLSFTASANCARYVGADIDFVDVDPATGNMCVHELTKKLETAQRAGRLPKAVVIVHYAGRACDVESFASLKQRYGFALIEDAAHALGAHYINGTLVGSSPLSDAVVFSFHPVKPITTGEGGMVVTHHAALANRIRMLRTHGITRDASQMQKKDMPAWYYEQQTLGYHYRITDMQAALGTSQMDKINRYIGLRRDLAVRYHALLRELPLRLPPPDAHCGWHLYAVQVDHTRTSHTRDQIFAALRAHNIGVNVHYIPIHLHPYYRMLGFTDGQFPAAEHFFNQCLSLPVYPQMTEADQDIVVKNLHTIMAS
jgi:UDP-4-amino-4,6-dideoxy-N-acetyl-beta-L-altrosamine transaminase